MAIGATGGDTGVVHRRIQKAAGALMAGLARSGGLDMVAGFTLGSAAVMAACTTRGDTSVVHCRAGKAAGALMASLTRGSGLDMSTWLAFSG